MADRMAHRRLPLFRHAKELVADATQAATATDPRALAALLDAKMDLLPPEQFELVIGMACVELQERRAVHDAVETLVATARDVSEAVEQDDGQGTAQLFGLVIRRSCASAIGTADRAALSHAQVDQTLATMVRHGLLAGQAQVTLLPRLLTPADTNALLAGEVYALTRALAAGDAALALQSVQDEHAKHCPAPRHPPGAKTVLILVGTAAERGGVPSR